MRLPFSVGVALLTVCLAAHADSLTQQLSIVNGNPTNNGYVSKIDTNAFNEFDPSLGTLTDVAASFEGWAYATTNSWGIGSLSYGNVVLSGQALGLSPVVTSPFSFYGFLNDTQPWEDSLFTGTGSSSFSLALNGPVTDVNLFGSVTYYYNPEASVAATPEPSSLALLGTGLLGALGVARRRLA